MDWNDLLTILIAVDTSLNVKLIAGAWLLARWWRKRAMHKKDRMPWDRRERKTRKRMRLSGMNVGEVYDNAVSKRANQRRRSSRNGRPSRQ